MSRQPLGEQRRQEQICALFTKDEKARVEEAARRSGVPPAVFLRNLALVASAVVAA